MSNPPDLTVQGQHGPMREFRAEPSAALLIESMRDIGYSLETALSDIVDNSISANASRVELHADPDPGVIAVLDDGEGMTWEELQAAMRPGSRSPLDERDSADLGRFGLGLKTASFSQCRRLTVASRKNGELHAVVWDLDYVAETDDWLVQIPQDVNGIPWIDQLKGTGTLVVWERLDRIIESGAPDKGYTQFVRRVDEARRHLELVFHRFLAGEPGKKKLDIVLNERPLEPLDPFHAQHPATFRGPVETIKVRNSRVTVQTFTLPHHRKVSAEDWERYAGPEGYLKNQGFYVYRERRLIIYGTWFGLAKQAELTKLARVRIDMPNDLDADWKIDVKKASAQPPYQVRERLRRIIEAIGADSKRVYTSRGRRLVSDDRLPVWNRTQDKNQITYRVNRQHPVIADFLEVIPEEHRRTFESVIEVVEAAMPLEMIFADIGSSPDMTSGGELTEEAMTHAIRKTVEKLSESGLSEDQIITALQFIEPFKSNWQQAQRIYSELRRGAIQSESSEP